MYSDAFKAKLGLKELHLGNSILINCRADNTAVQPTLVQDENEQPHPQPYSPTPTPHPPPRCQSYDFEHVSAIFSGVGKSMNQLRSYGGAGFS